MNQKHESVRLHVLIVLSVCCLCILGFLPSGAQAKPPTGWFLSGNARTAYTMRVDQKVKRSGKASGQLASNAKWKTGFGTMMQVIRADRYRGKRIQLSGWIKTEALTNWVGMWMRIDNRKRKAVAFDNMQNRPIKGTVNWKQVHIVLDVPKQAAQIAFGVLLSGKGKVWLDDLSLKTVSLRVPVTAPTHKILPLRPVNSGFEH